MGYWEWKGYRWPMLNEGVAEYEGLGRVDEMGGPDGATDMIRWNGWWWWVMNEPAPGAC
jgi:hypothetical protein